MKASITLSESGGQPSPDSSLSLNKRAQLDLATFHRQISH